MPKKTLFQFLITQTKRFLHLNSKHKRGRINKNESNLHLERKKIPHLKRRQLYLHNNFTEIKGQVRKIRSHINLERSNKNHNFHLQNLEIHACPYLQFESLYLNKLLIHNAYQLITQKNKINLLSHMQHHKLIKLISNFHFIFSKFLTSYANIHCRS